MRSHQPPLRSGRPDDPTSFCTDTMRTSSPDVPGVCRQESLAELWGR